MIAYRLDLHTGEWIDGKYKVVDRLGSGSYGDVYKVEDLTGQLYALKLLRLWEVPNDIHGELLNKFELEYKTSRLKSDYLVHSLDFGVLQGNPYLLMEYCPKGDLGHMVGGEIPNIQTYAHDILEGLYALHTEGKIHRDLKPENVLIRNNGKAALTDFGVVGEMEKKKRQSAINWFSKRPKQLQGTPFYMSLEIYDREPGGITYLPTVDIWSFGVMMYELLSHGHFPFGDITKPEELPYYFTKAKKNDWDRDRLKSIPKGNEWSYIIGRCLQPKYQDRYQSTLEVLSDMKPLLGNLFSNHIEERLSHSPKISGIVVTQGDNLGTSFVLSTLLKGYCRILKVGRENDNDIRIPEKNETYVSRYHFSLERLLDGSGWLIRDGQWKKSEGTWVTSTNGTYINSQRIDMKGVKLFTGDIITAGEYKFKVV